MDGLGILFWIVVFAVFVAPWIRARITRRRPIVGRPSIGNPRGLAESGGYDPDDEGRRQRGRPFPAVRRHPDPQIPYDVEESIRIRPATEERAPTASTGGVSPQALSVRRALGSPASIRTAFILREILDVPVGMRDNPWSTFDRQG